MRKAFVDIQRLIERLRTISLIDLFPHSLVVVVSIQFNHSCSIGRSVRKSFDNTTYQLIKWTGRYYVASRHIDAEIIDMEALFQLSCSYLKKNIVQVFQEKSCFSQRIFIILRSLPCEHWGSICRSENGQTKRMAVHSHYVENFEDLLQLTTYMQERNGLQWILKNYNFS